MAHNHLLTAHTYTTSGMFNFSVDYTTMQQTQFIVQEVVVPGKSQKRMKCHLLHRTL